MARPVDAQHEAPDDGVERAATVYDGPSDAQMLAAATDDYIRWEGPTPAEVADVPLGDVLPQPRDAAIGRECHPLSPEHPLLDDRGDAESSDITPAEAVRQFQERVGAVRLVRDMRTSKVSGIAVRDPDTGAWRLQRAETPGDAAYRQFSLRCLTDVAREAIGPLAAPPTDLDELTTLVTGAVAPSSIALKLCGAAVQAVAHGLGLGFCASLIGTLVEQTLKPVFMSDEEAALAAKFQVVDVTADVATGQLTAAVDAYAGAEIDELILRRTGGISQAELDRIEQRMQAERTASSIDEPELE